MYCIPLTNIFISVQVKVVQLPQLFLTVFLHVSEFISFSSNIQLLTHKPVSGIKNMDYN